MLTEVKPTSSLMKVVKFFILPSESVVAFGKEVKATLTPDEIEELARLIDAQKQ